ncbi:MULTISPECIES: efflux transporter outer membrane subunit [Methylobacillus]|uniref:RND efflux system, outer membrane lipoprotein, NodT n=1 Tax=Methylobacillus flagellatus (strain ATCC 51484 / DSM 6875 / VKM B-1610 / KT) TaxID=265072 RepID=Q1H1L0_METFK|nr:MULTISPECIES: efflux transporter outer membrane subunit [Methylobacillus]ABE49627.1 RND efflux system, outer membrane lipoprotein, NodT [Methylobacillus flagellatus KT]MPS49133.1 efflux transporter outer membrane subunit [Methylobacillus sp.]
MNHALKPIVFATGLLLGACSLNPEYHRPAAPVPVQYPINADADILPLPTSWQEYFTDPELQKLINIALANNRDLRMTALRIEEARAQYGIQRADRLPTLDATGTYERSKMIFAQGQTFDVDLYRASVGISGFELDFFGRVKSLTTALLEQYLATQEAQQTARTSLIAEVAASYVNIRALAERLALAKDTEHARNLAYSRILRRHQAGLDNAMDLKTAEMQLETAQASIAALQREYTQAVNALQLLAGQPGLAITVPQERLDRIAFSPLPVGLPSTLLERRPDIRAAEHRLKAANANIGAARAAFFPRIQLTTNVGLVNEHLSSLFSSSSDKAWAFSPQLTLPIFNHARNRANLDLARVRKEITVAEYEKAIQTAFSEVSIVLLDREQIEAQIASQTRIADADRERLRLAMRRYDKGVANYLELLDAQRSLFESEQQLVQLKQLSLTNSINLFKVLGGEWQAS